LTLRLYSCPPATAIGKRGKEEKKRGKKKRPPLRSVYSLLLDQSLLTNGAPSRKGGKGEGEGKKRKKRRGMANLRLRCFFRNLLQVCFRKMGKRKEKGRKERRVPAQSRYSRPSTSSCLVSFKKREAGEGKGGGKKDK